jgi:hypothetical protein
MEETPASALTTFPERAFPLSCGRYSAPLGTRTPLYMVKLYEEHRVPCYRVWLTLESHPLQPGWHSLDSKTVGFRADDTTEATTLKALTTFCGYNPLEMMMHPLGLFSAEKRDDPMWCNSVSHVKDVWAMHPDQVGRITVQCMSALYRLQALQSDAMTHLTRLARTTKITLGDREDFVVDLSSKLVEQDLQAEHMSNRIQALEQQVEIRDNTIEILENQLHDVQEELEEANAHIEMHHQDMNAMEAGSDEEEDPEEIEPASILDTAYSGVPPLHLGPVLPLPLRVRWVRIKHVTRMERPRKLSFWHQLLN